MKRTELKKLYEDTESFSDSVTVCGWIKSLRTGKGIAFISISDGSCFTPVQVVAEAEKLANFEEISRLNTGAAVSVSGRVIVTPIPTP